MTTELLGPWYTLDEAAQKLNIITSELHQLITNESLKAVAYTKPRPFILHNASKDGWKVYASCQYRGHITLSKHHIEKLLDKEDIEINTGCIKLLESSGLRSFDASNPFNLTLPSGPIGSWQPTEEIKDHLVKVAATPLPKEIRTTASTVKGLMTFVANTMNHRQEGNELIDNTTGKSTKIDQALLNKHPATELDFKANTLFSPDCLRIPESEIIKLKEKNTVGHANELKQNSSKKEERQSELNILIGRVVESNPTITARDAWKRLKEDIDAHTASFDTENILLHVDNEYIKWMSSYDNEQILKRSSFGVILSKIKKRKREQ